jgi:hypothetical protein
MKRRYSGDDNFVCWLLLFSLTIFGLISVHPFAKNKIHYAFAALFLLGAVMTARRAWRPSARAWIITAFVAVQAIALLRFAMDPVGTFSGDNASTRALLFVAMFVFFWFALWHDGTDRRLMCAVLAVPMFTVMNLLLFFGGIQGSASNAYYGTVDTSDLMSLVGVSYPSANMPMTPGLNAGGAMAAVSLIVAVILLRGRMPGRLKGFLLASIASSVVTIFITDSRGALIFALITILFLRLIPRASTRQIRYIAFLLPLGPLAVLRAIDWLAPFLRQFTSNPDSVSTVTGRTTIWDHSLDFIVNPRPPHGVFEQLVGYGFFGQVRSGSSATYGWLFNGDGAFERSAHNVALQTLLDQGLVGLVLLILTVAVVLSSATRSYVDTGSVWTLAIVGAVLGILLQGTIEVEITPTAPGTFATMILLCVAGTARTVTESRRATARTAPAVRQVPQRAT